MKSNYSLNLTYKFHALYNLQIRFSREKFEPGPGTGMVTWIAQWLRAPG